MVGVFLRASRWALAVSLLLALPSCAKGGEGASCDDKGDCRGELSCVAGYCRVDTKLHEKMARQSGVVVQSERPAAASSEGAVRVRKATGSEFAFALCADDERLTAGWCDPLTDGGTDNTHAVRQRIVGHTASDTVGARWTCTLRDEKVTAFALCQKIPSSPAASSPPEPEPSAPSP